MDIIQDYLYFNKEKPSHFDFKQALPVSLICNFLRHEIDPILDKVLTELTAVQQSRTLGQYY